METLNVIMQAITTVGFPIVAYGAMFWYMVRANDLHKAETDAIKESLNQNTLALQDLKGLLEMVVNRNEPEN